MDVMPSASSTGSVGGDDHLGRAASVFRCTGGRAAADSAAASSVGSRARLRVAARGAAAVGARAGKTRRFCGQFAELRGHDDCAALLVECAQELADERRLGRRDEVELVHGDDVCALHLVDEQLRHGLALRARGDRRVVLVVGAPLAQLRLLGHLPVRVKVRQEGGGVDERDDVVEHDRGRAVRGERLLEVGLGRVGIGDAGKLDDEMAILAGGRQRTQCRVQLAGEGTARASILQPDDVAVTLA